MTFIEHVVNQLPTIGMAVLVVYGMFLITTYLLWSNRLKRFISIKEYREIIKKDLRNEQRSLKYPSTDIILGGIIVSYLLGLFIGKM